MCDTIVKNNHSFSLASNSSYVPWCVILSNSFFDAKAPVSPNDRIWNFESKDLFVILLSALLLFLVRRVLTRFLFKPLAIRWKVAHEEIHRFCESAWFTLYHPVIVAFGLVVLWNASWFWDLNYLFLEFPSGHLADFAAGSNTPLLKLYALVGCAFYLQAIFALVFVDERMKDFNEMLVHHISTIALIFLSVFTMHHRVGSIILILHDVVDIFLYSAKMMHSAKKQMSANVLFFIFTLSFFGLRLVLFPRIIYRLYTNPERLHWPGTHFLYRHVPNAASPIECSSYGLCVNQYCISTYHFLNTLLLVLLVLHVYWFSMIVKLLIKTLSAGGNVPGDIRHKKNKKMTTVEPTADEEDAAGFTKHTKQD